MKYLYVFFFLFAYCTPPDDPVMEDETPMYYFFQGVVDGHEIDISLEIDKPLSGNINTCGGPGELLTADHLYQWCICNPNEFIEGYRFEICTDPIPESMLSDESIKDQWREGIHSLGENDWNLKDGLGIIFYKGNQSFEGSKGQNQSITIDYIGDVRINHRGIRIFDIGGTINFKTNDLSVENLKFLTFVTLDPL